MRKVSIEKVLEKHFVDWCNKRRIRHIKMPAYQYTGIPDREVWLKNRCGSVCIEFKGDTDYQRTAMQKLWGNDLMDSDPDRYFVINTRDELHALLTMFERSMADGRYQRNIYDETLEQSKQNNG